jgi:uncharacterized membrane protein
MPGDKQFGSWRFLGYMTLLIIVWISFDILSVSLRWDRYPFILLNLVFSTQASSAARLILTVLSRVRVR